ncbi:MAG TPA: ABC transporter substrate-binding protein [Acidimicrobiales bacterium]|nr:ABC transporter substrate-binding protein [Acidimicrobiales bacterium]
MTVHYAGEHFTCSGKPSGRHRALRLARLATAMIIGANFVWAIGSSVAAASSRRTAASTSAGMLMIATSLTTISRVTFDPTLAIAQAENIPWELAIYDTLLHRSPKTGAFMPGLATRVTIVNPTTIAITLRRGVRFSDGTPLDASAVRFGLLRNKNASQHGQFDSSLQQIASIDVTGQDTLTINLASPVAGQLYDQFYLPSTYLVSPSAAQKPGANLATAPVGAGPYELQSYVPDQSITLVRNPDYWDAKAIKLRAIEFINVPTATQQVNALEGGTVNLTQLSNFSSVSALRGRYPVVQVRTPNAPLWSNVCKSASPLSDVRVRQALNYAIDRPLIVKTIQAGIGSPEWNLWPSGTPYFDKSLVNVYNYDPKKAKALLAAAGFPNGFDTTMLVIPGSALAAEVDQVLQQEWQAIGVHLTLTPALSFADLYVKHLAPLGVVSGSAVGSFGPVSGFAPGTISDLCNYADPTIDALYAQAKAVSPASPKGVALLRQMQHQIIRQALGIFISTLPAVFAHSSSVRALTMNPYYDIAPIPDYWSGIVSSSA